MRCLRPAWPISIHSNTSRQPPRRSTPPTPWRPALLCSALLCPASPHSSEALITPRPDHSLNMTNLEKKYRLYVISRWFFFSRADWNRCGCCYYDYMWSDGNGLLSVRFWDKARFSLSERFELMSYEIRWIISTRWLWDINHYIIANKNW